MNPEFQRNLWLETSPRRLAWAGVVLVGLYGATAALAQGSLGVLAGVGVVVFAIAALIWGPRATGRSIAGEVAQRTWDFQRLSALTPWALAWGKLLGSASLAWLVAATGLAIVGAQIAVSERDVPAALAWLLGAVGLAVVLQAGTLALGLVGVRRARAEGRIAPLRLTLGTAVGVAVVMWAISHVIVAGAGGDAGTSWLSVWGGSVDWWGTRYPFRWFAAVSLAVFAGWAVLAVWRLMRLEMQAQNGPWSWTLFVVFAGVYAAGFSAGSAQFSPVARAFGAFAICAYAAAFAEPADPVDLRGWIAAVARFDLKRAFINAPAVVAPLKLSVLAVVVMLAMRAPTPVAPYDLDWKLTALAVFAFLVRDVAVIAYFRFGPRAGRGDFGAVLGLFLLYFAGSILGRAILGQEGGALFVPAPMHAAVSLASGLVQAVAAWAFAWSRLRPPPPKSALPQTA